MGVDSSKFKGGRRMSIEPVAIRSSKKSLQQAQAYINRNDIKYVRFESSDYYAISHCKVIPARHFQAKARNGITATFSHIGMDPNAAEIPGTGYVREEVNFSDCVYYPDLSTLRKVPWAKETARVLLYATKHDELVAGYPRTVADRLLQELRGMGFSLYTSYETEFHVFDANTKEPITEGVQIRSTIRIAKHGDFVQQIGNQLSEIGVDIESLETEYAPGLYEITYKPTFGVRAADNAFTCRNGIKEIAQKNGFLATFMTKPYAEYVGAAAQVNHSLWDAHEKKCLMFDASSPHGLSKVAQHWLAGLLYHAPAITVLVSPTVNCMQRISTPNFAPRNATWGVDNRSASIRVKVNGEKGTYLESRICGAAGCPYISLAATVAAGMDGLKNKYELPPPVDGVTYSVNGTLPPKTIQVPSDMESALKSLLNDDVICNALGDDFIKCFVALKTHEAKLEAEAIKQGKSHHEWAFDYYTGYM